MRGRRGPRGGRGRCERVGATTAGPAAPGPAADPPPWCGTVKISSAPTPTAAAVAVPAATACEWCRTRCQAGGAGGLTDLGNPFGPNGPARPTTVARCTCPASVWSAQIRRTRSRNPGMSVASGSTPTNSAGLSSRRLRSPQILHRSMCRLTRLRTSTFICPSHPARAASSSAQAPRPVRATTRAPRDRSSWLRARDSSACAWLRFTPSASARSSPSSSCSRLSSMTSRSPRFSPSIAAMISSRSSSCSAASPTSGASVGVSTASSSGAVASPERRRRRHSLRATAYSHGRSLPGSRSAPSFEVAMRKVSCTTSAASSGSRSRERQ